MKDKDYNWLTNNLNILGNVKATRDQLQRMFDIYNDITKENKRTTQCGRCVYNIKKRLLVEYEKISSIQNSKG